MSFFMGISFLGYTGFRIGRPVGTHRYPWHDFKAGTSALFDETGALTSTGRLSAAIH
jgi:hypothetical protein